MTPPDRVRHDTIGKAGTVTLRIAGRLHHIGISRTYVILLVQDLNVRVIDAATGQLFRELTIDPLRDYQPTGGHRDHDAKGNSSNLRSVGSSYSDVLRHHKLWTDLLPVTSASVGCKYPKVPPPWGRS